MCLLLRLRFAVKRLFIIIERNDLGKVRNIPVAPTSVLLIICEHSKRNISFYLFWQPVSFQTRSQKILFSSIKHVKFLVFKHVKFEASTLNQSHNFLVKLSFKSTFEKLVVVSAPYAVCYLQAIMQLSKKPLWLPLRLRFLYLHASVMHQHTFNRSRVATLLWNMSAQYRARVPHESRESCHSWRKCCKSPTSDNWLSFQSFFQITTK